jgi:hypothetical protein
MRRVIWVNSSERGEPVPRPIYTDAQKAAYAECLRRGRELLKVSGQFSWEPEAAEFFDQWYRANHARMMKPGTSPVVVNMLRSRDQFVLKVSMATTLAHTDELVLRKPALEFAIGMLENIEEAAFRTFEHTGRNELAFLSSKVLDYVTITGEPVPLKQVYLLCHNDASTAETDAILHQLVQTDQIKRFKLARAGIEREYLATPTQYQKLLNDQAARSGQPSSLPVVSPPSPTKSAPDEL